MVARNLFSKGSDAKTILDWLIERPKSDLACKLLELVRISFKDLRQPDFSRELYNQVEVLICPLLENFDTPALLLYG